VKVIFLEHGMSNEEEIKSKIDLAIQAIQELPIKKREKWVVHLLNSIDSELGQAYTIMLKNLIQCKLDARW
jgi:hypothetical protein